MLVYTLIGGNLPTGDNTWIFMAVRFCKPEQSSKRGFTCWNTESMDGFQHLPHLGSKGCADVNIAPSLYHHHGWIGRSPWGIGDIAIIGCYNPWDPWAHHQTGHVVHLRWYGEVLLCRSRVRIGSHDQPEMPALNWATLGSSHGTFLDSLDSQSWLVTSDFFEDTSWVVILKTNFKSVAWCKWFNFRLCFQGKMNGFRA
jgi:hypothetical protein